MLWAGVDLGWSARRCVNQTEMCVAKVVGMEVPSAMADGRKRFQFHVRRVSEDPVNQPHGGEIADGREEVLLVLARHVK